ncbi:hypothetical protein I6U48_02265 [Clostridium sp. PL3]|uniref:DUF2178 domain-containing protein n=1 Tax=Clostridium thailandense TaxID=2794346 RepID=A0A949TVH5_9CLOT|nr:hypothetical protein [Clostridium thailandense]MBV7271738.1 hypothetical protein [Clostridium thailandense]
MRTSKLGVDFIGFIRTTIIGLIGGAIYLYSNSQGITGGGMRFTKVFSSMFIIIGIAGIILTKFFENNPIKSIGVVNKDDEMQKLIRYKAAYAAFEITMSAIMIFIMLIAAEIIKLTMPLYMIGIVLLVAMGVINIVSIVIYSNKMS